MDEEIRDLIIEDLDKLIPRELTKVYKFIRTKIIANIPEDLCEWKVDDNKGMVSGCGVVMNLNVLAKLKGFKGCPYCLKLIK